MLEFDFVLKMYGRCQCGANSFRRTPRATHQSGSRLAPVSGPRRDRSSGGVGRRSLDADDFIFCSAQAEKGNRQVEREKFLMVFESDRAAGGNSLDLLLHYFVGHGKIERIVPCNDRYSFGRACRAVCMDRSYWNSLSVSFD